MHCTHLGSGKVKVTSFHLENTDGKLIPYAVSGSPVVFVIGFETNGEKCNNISVGFSVKEKNERNLFQYYSHLSDTQFSDLPLHGEFRCLISDCLLAPGDFLVGFMILSNGVYVDWPKVSIPITVHIGDFYKTGFIDGPIMSWGPILVRGSWSVRSQFSIDGNSY